MLACKDSSLAWVLLGRVELRGEGQIDYRAQRQWPVYFKEWPVYFKELILSICELIPVGGIHWLKGGFSRQQASLAPEARLLFQIY
jgi:hypothetical protein